MRTTNTLIIAAGSLLSLASCSQKALVLQKDNIDEIVEAMTLEEKALLITGVGMDSGSEGLSATIGAQAELVPGAAGSTHAIPRLGIPQVVLSDGPAGLRINPTRPDDANTYYCTHFPIGTLLASTWNQELIEQVGASIGNEVLEYGADVLLAPALNIHRNPLNGRNFEYYSEDPVISGKTAAAYVRGVQSNGVGTSVKHFMANSQETNRTGVNSIIGTRALREIYLKGFEIVVKEADPWTIMTSYNYVNNVYTSENPELLEDVVRTDWGYKGTVMTDWYGGKSAAAQVHAGNDMLQPGRPSQYQEIIDGVTNGSISEDDLNRNVKRILQLVVRTPRFNGYEYSNAPDLTAHAAVTRQSAVEGMVLLENKADALPFGAEVRNVAVFGLTSYDLIAGGTGSGNVNRAYTVSLLDGLNNAGYKVDESVKGEYTAYLAKCEAEKIVDTSPLAAFLPPVLPAEYVPETSSIASSVGNNDAAIITIGRISGEFVDRTVADFNLSKEESTLIRKVSDAFHAAGKKVVVVLNIGGVVETASWKDIPDAILLSWQAGQEGGNSIADVLTGKESPSGKLPMTWPLSFADHKSSENFPRAENFELDLSTFLGTEAAAKEPVDTYDWTNHKEGIWIGYRWFDKADLPVSYPFGYGLSYTTFEFSNASVENDGETITVSVDVKNTGEAQGKEVVELYVSAPGKTMEKPVQELKAYAKTRKLAAGESQRLKLNVPVDDLASFCEEDSSWEVEEGTYKFNLGSSSRDIKAVVEAEVEAQSTKVRNVLKSIDWK